MDKGKRHRPRGGRERTTEAILDAAEKLFSQRGFAAVSVRDIAAEAGVSHALVHRYLGSKAQVYRTMLLRRETVIRDAAPDVDDLIEATKLMLREAVLHQRGYVRMLASSALDGLSFERTVGRFAATERLVEIAEKVVAGEGEARGPDARDPRFVIASIVAMLLGWSAAREWILKAVDLEPMSDEEFCDEFESIVLDLERLYFPTLGGPAAE
ncbi:MAG TPA: helix-turn-helix domain-containing protein [Thermoleophilia bacterium]|nr:helix-turn-helix domain-containing protein [Thermoleophilia bacterium]